jgi:EmrB/QacA subfamily drug resistance transporter
MSERMSPALLKLAGVVVLGALMMQLDGTMTSIATSTLLDEFQVPLSTLQWVGTGYLLAMAAVIPLAGWSMERFGARAVWIFSLFAFLAGSVLCGVSWSMPTLITARVVQGLGGGMILPVAQAVVAQQAGPDRMARAMAAIGVPALLGPVLGPILGGVIVSDLGWRWIFFVNVPICVAAVIAAWRVMPSDRSATRSRLDVPGLLMLSVGSATLIYGFAEAGRRGGFTAAAVLLPLAIGLVLLLAFVPYARRASEPLIDLQLFRNRGYSASLGAMFLTMMVMFGAMGLLPLFYQQVRHFSAEHTGVMMIPFGLGTGVSIVVSSRLADRFAARWIALTGLMLAGTGTVVLTQLGHDPGAVVLGLAQAVTGLGVGSVMVPVMATALRGLPQASIPHASTTLRIFQQLGGSVGGAILFIVLQHQIGLSSSNAAAAYGHTFWWAIGFAAVALVPVLLLPARRSLPSTAGELAAADATGA